MFTGAGVNSTGVYAQRGGRVLAEGSSIQNAGYGSFSNLAGYVDVQNCTISNSLVGGYASFTGYLDAENCTFTGITSNDLVAQYNGTIDGQDNPTATKGATFGGTIFS